MCGRFTLTSSQEQIAEVLPGLVFDTPIEPRYNIAPTQTVPAVLNDGQMQVVGLHWGLIPFWATDPAIGNRMINARAESLAEKPSFRKPLKSQRCIILADGFYEWQKVAGQKNKRPMYVHLRDHKPFGFAGLWDRWKNPQGDTIVSCTIVTTEPNDLLTAVHDRMPVILQSQHIAEWLETGDQSKDIALQCLVPYPSEQMTVYQVSTRVNRPANDDPDCITPVEGDTLF